MTEYIANFELNRNSLEFQGALGCNKLQADLVLQTGDKHFTFEQGIATNHWIIRHNLNKQPSVVAVDTAGAMQIPDEVIYIDKNTVEVYFISPFAGKAYLN